MGYKRGILAILCILFMFCFSYDFAIGTEGTSTGSGGSSGCKDYSLSTCYGATWRWYATNSDSVSIAGFTESKYAYAKATTITGCKKWGGYWRYAMVAKKDYEYSGAKKYYKGDQYGVVGISGNSDSVFNSEFLDGHMNYIPKSVDFRNADWADVKAIYEELQKVDGSLTKGFKKGSNLAWFCGPKSKDEITPKYRLTGSAVDTNGNDITTTGGTWDSGSIKSGNSAKITAGTKTGWTFLGWRSSKSSGTPSGGIEYSVSSLTGNITVYAVYRRNTFEAKMEVTDNNANSSNTKKVTTIDWTSENNNSTEKYIKCASTCSVNFKHYLRQKEGTGGANKYKISTRLNSNSISYIGGNTFKEITPGTDGISLRDQNTTLNLGDTYYEKLEFYKYKEEEARSLTVTVKAPYNFENTVSINTTDNIVYAGETASIETTITIGDRQNDTVGESYATSVPGAKTKLFINYDNGEEYTVDENLGTISIANNGSRSQSINIKDLPAGTKLTAKFCLYPKNSISDINTTTNFGNDNDINNWACSDEKEFTIAKRPSFQIWGGGLYSAGEVKTTPAIKNNLASVDGYPYSAQGNGNKLAFGSWTELNIVGDKTITGLASGTGIFGEGEDYCKRVPLSFANKDCKSNITGGLNMNSTSSNVSSDKSALISRFDDPNSDDYILKEHTGDYSIDGIDNFSTEKITGDDGTIIREAPTMVIVVDGTLTINGNITYESDGYTNLEAVPKIILYAKNIIMSCNVTRVDAVLIAEQNINTCNNDDVNSSDRSNQLIVNGSIISNTLTLNRTYGAATGMNSIIPAEIINYDSSIYLWAHDTSSVTKTGKIVTTYQQELPPRY